VVWESKDQDGSGKGVFGQQYAADGGAVGSEFQVTTYTDHDQKAAIVTALVDGGYVVVWESKDQDGSGKGVFAQHYRANGDTAGAEFQINTTTAGDQKHLSVAALTASEGGGFVVTWESADVDKKGVFSKRFLDVDDEAPTVVINSGLTLDEGATAALTGLLLYRDPDTLDATLIYEVVGGVSNGQLELSTAPGTAITSFTQAQLTSGEVVYVHDGGETISASFDFTVSDPASNVLVGQSFAITVNPVDDAPVIMVDESAGDSSSEEVTQSSGTGLAVGGTLTVSDEDLTDTASASVTGVSFAGDDAGLGAAALLDMMNVDLGDVIDASSTTGTIHWEFDSGTEAFAHLAAGETLVLTYSVTVNPTVEVTITITGTNDAPVIEVGAGDSVAGAVIEDGVAQASGTVGFSDADLSDDHSVSAALASSDNATSMGTFSVVETADTTGTGTGGEVTWTYDIDNAAAQQLAAGQVVNEVHTITIEDNNGDTVTQDVTVTITSVNDAPVLDLNGAGVGEETSLGYFEGTGAVLLAPDAVVTRTLSWGSVTRALEWARSGLLATR